MHPLRFPNSGIRVKVFVRKIGFNLRVMRFYRVESFQCVRSKNNEEGLVARGSRLRPRPTARGQLATTNPPCRGGWLHLRPPCKGAAYHPQGAAARRGISSPRAATLPAACPQGAAANRGDDANRPLVGPLPAATRSAAAYAGTAVATSQEGVGEG
ncbi:hypothetical protein GW17_00024720 [Ensete ventricosum]|nr:hypothetical protein GW17_00024720 [Ensete ventricosum]